jgi:hypothetical protein
MRPSSNPPAKPGADRSGPRLDDSDTYRTKKGEDTQRVYSPKIALFSGLLPTSLGLEAAADATDQSNAADQAHAKP